MDADELVEAFLADGILLGLLVFENDSGTALSSRRTEWGWFSSTVHWSVAKWLLEEELVEWASVIHLRLTAAGRLLLSQWLATERGQRARRYLRLTPIPQ